MKGLFYTTGSIIFLTIILVYGAFILKPMTLGLLIAMIFHPIITKVSKVLKYHGVSFLITFLGVALALTSVLGIISFQLFSLFDDLRSERFSLEVINTSLLNFLKKLGVTSGQADKYISQGLNNALATGSELVTSVISSSTSVIITGVVGIVLSYFFSAYYDGLREAFVKSFDRKQRKKIDDICDEIPSVIRKYLRGMSIVMVVLAVVNTIVYFAIGLDYALVWGVLSGFLAFIPYLGSAIALILPLSYSIVTSDSITQPLIIIGSFIIVQQIEGNVLTPKIVGESVDINPLAAIIFMILSAQVWGIYGVFISIMVAGILKVVLDQWKAYDTYVMLMSDDVDDQESALSDVLS